MQTPTFIQRSGVVKRCSVAYAQIELLPLAGCVGCERQRAAGLGPGHCGIDILGLSEKKNRTLVSVPLNDQQRAELAPGCAVDVHIPAPNGRWLALAFQVYGLPTFGLIAGAATGGMVNEGASVVISVFGCWAGLQFGRRLAHVSHSNATLIGSSLRATRIVRVDG